MPRLALGGIALLLACGQASTPAKPGETKTEPAAPPAAVAKDCDEQHSTELRELLEASCSAPLMVDTKKLAVAAWPSDAKVGDAIPIEVSRDGAATPYAAPHRADEFAAWLHEEIGKSKAMAEAKGEPWHGNAALYVHVDAPLAQVDAVVKALRAETIEAGWLVFASATRRTPKPRYPELQAKFQAEIDAVEPTMKAMELAKRLRPIAERCAQISDVFGKIAADSAETRCTTLARGLATAVVTCGCPDYEPELIAWVQLLGGPPDTPAEQAQRVGFTATDPIHAAATTTWAELVATRKDGFTSLALALDR